MELPVRILINTPYWVFALLAYLVWQGCLALRPRTTPFWRMLLVPAIFFLMGVSGLVLGGKSSDARILWLLAAIAFAGLALSIPRQAIRVDGDGMVTRPGSVMPLLRNLTIFSLQYVAAVMAAMRLDSQATVAMIGQAVSGACAGYFFGTTVALLRRYRAARKSETAV